MADESESLAVEHPEIDEVFDLRTGEFLSADEAIGSDFDKALRLRMALKQGNVKNQPLLVCPLCHIAVHMVSLSSKREFYFRHETEDGRCPAKTKGKLSPDRILAIKYHGLRESEPHRRMKEIIAESILQDPDFSEPEIEPFWKGMDANDHRRPDVRAIWRGSLPVAFEVQLSTTFLQVIAERRNFYLKEGGLLLWVFRSFDPADRRLTHEDIFHNNNRNAFIVSDETLRTSKETKSLVLNCLWHEPRSVNGEIHWSSREDRIPFRTLTIDRPGQRVFHFDADAALSRTEKDLRDAPLRDEFKRLWLADSWDVSGWISLREKLMKRGITIPRYTSDEPGFRPLIDSLFSAAEGRPIGWGFATLVKIGHHLFDRHKGFLWAFKLMLAAHGRGPQIVAEDPTKKWCRGKVPAYHTAWRDGDPAFEPDRRFDALVAFLFPEIAKDLKHPPT